MKRIRFPAFLLAALLALTAIAAPAGALAGGDWQYEVNEDGVTASITRYVGSATEVTIPSEIDGYRVTALTYWKEWLSSTAFQHRGVFEDLSVTSVVFPAGVTEIGERAFSECRSMTSITLSGGLKKIGYAAFYNCVSLTDVSLPDGLKEIDEWAFVGCLGLGKMKIPESVEDIGACAFYDCGLTEISIPDGVRHIGKEILKNNPVRNAYLDNGKNAFWIGNHLIEVRTGFSGTFEVKPGTKTIADGAFANCALITGVTIPESVTAIGAGTFNKCVSLRSVTIPDSVKSIGGEAFSGCILLTEAAIPDGVTAIGDKTFSGCTSLASVTIPESVTAIGERAFYKCSSLKTVNYGGSKRKWKAIKKGSDNEALDSAEIVFAKEDPALIPGDLTGDGKINSRDVIAIMKLVITQNGEVNEANDLNDDGKINSRDVILLMKLVIAQA